MECSHAGNNILSGQLMQLDARGTYMSFSQAILPELPFLRRYARAVTGSQAFGDAAVREMLEALLEAPDELNLDRPVRLELYRIFHRIWNPEAQESLSTSAPTSQLSPLSRQALMLTSLEGFTEEEAGEILDQDTEIVADNIRRAREVIAQLLVSDVMIIEDEAIIALHIKSIVSDMGHNVTGIARTRDEAVKLARSSPPELVLADISLADGSNGVDAVRDILADLDVPVIFVTAFPERLLTGERLEPTYLITKPFEPPALTATIAQALMFHRESAGLSDSVAA